MAQLSNGRLMPDWIKAYSSDETAGRPKISVRYQTIALTLQPLEGDFIDVEYHFGFAVCRFYAVPAKCSKV